MRKKPGMFLCKAGALMAALMVSFPSASAADSAFDGVIRIGGSSTLLPAIAESASTFMEKYPTWDKVDPTLPKKQTVIFVTGGGSGFGINSTISGAVQIGLSTRALKEEEKARLGEHETFLVGKDCLAAVTHKQGPLAGIRSNLSHHDASRILSGEAKTWKDVDPRLPATPIVLFIRDMAGSANELLQKEVLKDRTFSSAAIQLPSMGAIMKRSEENVNGLAFLSSGMAIRNEKLKVYAYQDVTPSNDNVLSGKYVLSRPMLLVVKGKPSKAEKAFIDFVLGEGQNIIESHGYIPVKGMHQR